MTSYRYHFRPSRREGRNKGSLFIRVIHNRRYKDIRRHYRIYPDEWNETLGIVKLPNSTSGRYCQLLDIQTSMSEDLDRLKEIVNLFSSGGEYNVQDVSGAFEDSTQCDTLQNFSMKLSKELRANEQFRTARAYRSAAKSIIEFNQSADIPLAAINTHLIRSYEQYLLNRGLQMNTVSFYMRNLRAIYFRAVKAGIIPRQDENPFASVFTGVYATRRRALDNDDLNALAELEKRLSTRLEEFKSRQSRENEQAHSEENLREAVMLFLFSFHSRGMSFIDLAYLKKSEVGKESLIYKRKKTGTYMEIKLTKAMKRIIRHFNRKSPASPYIFPVIKSESVDHRLQYESGLSLQNRRLKNVRELAGIKKNLSTHVARHSWATTAKRMGYSIPLISEGLGHRDTKVTQIYLDSFERSAMDELSTRVSGAVRAA